MIFLAKRFTYSEREALASPKKVYLLDPGLATLPERSMDMGRRVENLVYLELIRRGYEPHYYITRGKEVDSVAARGETHSGSSPGGLGRACEQAS